MKWKFQITERQKPVTGYHNPFYFLKYIIIINIKIFPCCFQSSSKAEFFNFWSPPGLPLTWLSNDGKTQRKLKQLTAKLCKGKWTLFLKRGGSLNSFYFCPLEADIMCPKYPSNLALKTQKKKFVLSWCTKIKPAQLLNKQLFLLQKLQT